MAALELDESPLNLAGQLDDRYIVLAPTDDSLQREAHCYQVFDQKDPAAVMYMLVAATTRGFRHGQSVVHRHIAIMQKAKGKSERIPTLVQSGKVPQLTFGQDGVVHEEAHPDVVDRAVCIFKHNTFPIKTLLSFTEKGYLPTIVALAVGQGMVRALATVHRLGFVHRGVSPYSFGYKIPVSICSLQYEMVCIDFSLILPYPSCPRRRAPFVGIPRYCSIRAHDRHEHGPADDIISVIYCVAEMITGKLPWRSIPGTNNIAVSKRVFEESICYKHLPKELRRVFKDMHDMTQEPVKFGEVLDSFQSAIRRYAYQIKDLPNFMC